MITWREKHQKPFGAHSATLDVAVISIIGSFEWGRMDEEDEEGKGFRGGRGQVSQASRQISGRINEHAGDGQREKYQTSLEKTCFKE